MATQIDCKSAQAVVTDEPVPRFGLRFSWHPNYWAPLFDRQIDLIRRDIGRALADRKLIVYLSCPISARGGADHSTNVEIARVVERRLLAEWGERFWILNPAQYQMESEEGRSMMQDHAAALEIDLSALEACYPSNVHVPTGGDYMRMWTRVLVEDAPVDGSNPPRPYFDPPASEDPSFINAGQHFDAFYFIGPTDVHRFFGGHDGTLSGAIETHFARKFDTDPDFRDAFTVDGLQWGAVNRGAQPQQMRLRRAWETMRRNYLRFYALRASANFSLGSHDEWNIFRRINEIRRGRYGQGDARGIADQLAGYFDGRQIHPGASEAQLSNGYGC